MINDAPGTFTPLEIARNRLAKALFLLCLTIFVLAITIDRSASEFFITDQKLAGRVGNLRLTSARICQRRMNSGMCVSSTAPNFG